MIKYPLLYLILYCKIRRKKKGEITCNKKDFRLKLAQPLGVDSRTAEFVLRDFKRYKMIRDIERGRNGRIVFKSMNENADLFNDLVELRKVGLI
jgi:hypothetical protein